MHLNNYMHHITPKGWLRTWLIKALAFRASGKIAGSFWASLRTMSNTLHGNDFLSVDYFGNIPLPRENTSPKKRAREKQKRKKKKRKLSKYHNWKNYCYINLPNYFCKRNFIRIKKKYIRHNRIFATPSSNAGKLVCCV